jgi:hypothetical protein
MNYSGSKARYSTTIGYPGKGSPARKAIGVYRRCAKSTGKGRIKDRGRTAAGKGWPVNYGEKGGFKNRDRIGSRLKIIRIPFRVTRRKPSARGSSAHSRDRPAESHFCAHCRFKRGRRSAGRTVPSAGGIFSRILGRSDEIDVGIPARLAAGLGAHPRNSQDVLPGEGPIRDLPEEAGDNSGCFLHRMEPGNNPRGINNLRTPGHGESL